MVPDAGNFWRRESSEELHPAEWEQHRRGEARDHNSNLYAASFEQFILMAPQKNGTYALRMHGRTGCIFIDRADAEKLAGTAFNREDPINEVTLGVSF